MAEDTSSENLRKFLESDDLGLCSMGLSMAKGSGVPNEMLGEILWMYMFHDDETIRAAAKSTFMKLAPEEAKQVVKENWKASYGWQHGSILGMALCQTSVSLVGQLIKALEDDDWRVRSSAVVALRKIGDERAVGPLAEHYRKYGSKCIIFDCDGTLVDSEELTNEIIAEMAGELGIKMTGEEATATFGGKTLGAVLYRMRELSGNEIPDDWLPRLIERVSEVWKTELNPVNGVRELLEGLEIPICVASNGEPRHINQSLRMTGLHDFFKEQIYTASDVGSPKPAPDLFLYAAKKMGFAPSNCVVVEDSIPGVMAANRAKIKVYGLVKLCSAEELENAGAIPFTNMRDLPSLLGI